MKRVRVLRDNIDKGDPSPILVESVDSRGFVTFKVEAAEVNMQGNVRMVYDPEHALADGTRVWIECDTVEVLRRS